MTPDAKQKLRELAERIKIHGGHCQIRPETVLALLDENERLRGAVQFFKDHENDEKRGAALRGLWDALNATEQKGQGKA